MTLIERIKYIMRIDWFELCDDEDFIKQLIYDILTDDIGECVWTRRESQDVLRDGVYYEMTCCDKFYPDRNDIGLRGIKFCPHCGRKIKVSPDGQKVAGVV